MTSLGTRFTLLSFFLLLSVTAHSQKPFDAAPYGRVVILGDSITHHSPASSLGWAGNWGMAASAEEKDYVHLFMARLAAARGPNAPAPELLVLAEGGGLTSDKVALTDKIIAFHPDLALIQLGENDNKDVSVEGFQKPYEKLIEAIRAGNPKARVLCAGVWGYPNGSPEKDAMIRAACSKLDASFASLAAVNADPDNRVQSEGRFTHPGVNWHPGDRGMAGYADAFWRALTGEPASSPTPSSTPRTAATTVEENWGTPLLLVWSPTVSPVKEEGLDVLKVSSGKAETVISYSTVLDVAKFAGRKVRIQTRVKGISISEKPKSWNGVKLMFGMKNAEGKADYSQFPLPAGSFDWIDVDWLTRIPDNTVSLRLILGLEQVTGSALFDAIHISTVD